MKVLQVGKFFPILGGVEKVMLELQEGLSCKGIVCDMLCANSKIGEASYTLKVNAKSRIICTKTLKKKFATMISPSMVWTLRKICNNYDILHIHHPDPMAALSLFLSNYRGKVIVHWHSDILRQKFLLNFFRPLQEWLLNRADLIIGTSPIYVTQSPHLKDVQNKCTYLPIGIEPLEVNLNYVRKIKQQYKEKKIIFSLGRLVEYKGYKYLLNAAKFLPDNYVVLIGGTGPLRDKLQHQIRQDKLDEKVKLLGRIDDNRLSSFYGACDLYCLPSIAKTEAFAIVQVEAMSCGKPIVATNIPESGVSWVNAHGISGINVPIKNSLALANAIIEILENRELYDKLSQGAKQRFNQLFTKEKMIEALLDIYQGVLTTQ